MIHRKKGFTLTELMVVVAIMGMIAVAAAPSVMSRIPNHRLSQANWQVYMDLNQAKARAVSTNKDIVVNINSGAKTYTFWSDDDRDDVRDTGEEITRSLANIPNISLTAYPTEFRYLPDGTMDAGYYYVYVRVSEPTAGQKTVYTFPNGSIDGYQVQNM